MTPQFMYNPQWADAEHTAINVDVVFDGQSPIPFTAREEDSAPYTNAIWNAVLYGVAGEIAEYVAPPPIVPASITRRQLLLQMLSDGLITVEEATEAATTGRPPAAIRVYFNMLQQAQRDEAYITFASMSVCERNHPLVALLGMSNGLDDEQIDEFFIAAAQR